MPKTASKVLLAWFASRARGHQATHRKRLALMGRMLKLEKTQIVHTLEKQVQGAGFDFRGFEIGQCPVGKAQRQRWFGAVQHEPLSSQTGEAQLSLSSSGILAKMEKVRFSSGTLFANRFEIERTAGSGGMGTVYRARDRYSGEIVALKLLHSGTIRTDEDERFAREAQLLSELRHPGIVAHVAHGQTPDGQRFLAMEWLDGEDLAQRLARGPLPLRDCLRLLEQVAEALSLAHQRGVIHRDLKPSNLFLAGGDVGRVKILDFGIARRIAASHAMTRTGMVIGTPEYMAPEQARGTRELLPATDIFSLGCVLYECLTGQPPFVADHVAAVLVRILFEDPIPVEECRLGIPVAVCSLVERMLAKDPAQRLGDAAALHQALSALGEVTEPTLAATMASPQPKAPSFAELEQSLFSVVLAAPPEEDAGLDATLRPTDLLQGSERQALLQALQPLGVSADFLASGALVVTVPPTGSATDQVTRGARAALLIKERWPAAVVSMATGRGAIRGRTAVGEVIEAAARSLKTGSNTEGPQVMRGVLIDALSAKLLEGRFSQTPKPSGALLLGEARDVDASRPLLGKPTPCVGREPDLATLEAQLTGCLEESEARVMLVTAPPGIGKSRLRHEFMRRVERRSEPLTVLVGRGDLMSAGAPYAMLRDAIHKLCGIGGGEPLDIQRERLRARVAQRIVAADQERVVLFVGELCNVPFPEEGMPILQAARQDPKVMRDCLRRALLDFLAAECAAAPLLLVLDDLQWGDELTVAVLNESLREQAGAPLFILSFARPEIHEAFPKLWQGHKVQELQLKGLSKKACERLILQVLGKEVPPESVARAVEQSAGNALFLEELIRSIAAGKTAEQPDSVVAMLQARIGRLHAGARRAVRAAAIFGQTFWRNGVSAILQVPKADPEVDSWLEALADAEIVQPQAQSRLANDKEYGFRHALVRDAAYTLLTLGDLATGHRLAGEFLIEAGEYDDAMIAEHFERSGDQRRAALYYSRAASDGLARGNYAGALRLVERGLACQPDGELLGQLSSIESYVLLVIDRYERMSEVTGVALRHLKAGSLGWCRAIFPAFFVAINHQDAARIGELVSLLLSTEPDPDARATYVESVAIIHIISAVVVPEPVLRALLNRLATVVAQAAPANPMIRRYLNMCRAWMANHREPGPWTLVKECEQALSLIDQSGDIFVGDVVGAATIEWGWLELGDREGVSQRLTALTASMGRCQNNNTVNLWRHLLARSLCMATDSSSWDKAASLVAPMLSYAGGLSSYPSLAQGLMARLSLLRGRPQEAEAHARAAMQLFPMFPIWLSHVAPVQIHALLDLGRAAEATAVAEQVFSALPAMGGFGVAEVEFRLSASEAFHAAGERERARTELRETLRQVQLRADDIQDAFWKNSYLTRNPYCARAQTLGHEWGLDFTGK